MLNDNDNMLWKNNIGAGFGFKLHQKQQGVLGKAMGNYFSTINRPVGFVAPYQTTTAAPMTDYFEQEEQEELATQSTGEEAALGAQQRAQAEAEGEVQRMAEQAAANNEMNAALYARYRNRDKRGWENLLWAQREEADARLHQRQVGGFLPSYRRMKEEEQERRDTPPSSLW